MTAVRYQSVLSFLVKRSVAGPATTRHIAPSLASQECRGQHGYGMRYYRDYTPPPFPLSLANSCLAQQRERRYSVSCFACEMKRGLARPGASSLFAQGHDDYSVQGCEAIAVKDFGTRYHEYHPPPTPTPPVLLKTKILNAAHKHILASCHCLEALNAELLQ